MKKILFLIILSFFFVGCGSQVMQLPTPEVPESQIVGHCREAAGGYLLMGMFPIMNNGRLERAYNHCLNTLGASSLTNVSVIDRWFWTPGGNGFISIVEADGVK